MRPHLHRTPFSRHWRPVLMRVYPGLMPDRMDDLTHAELGMLLDDFEAITR